MTVEELTEKIKEKMPKAINEGNIEEKEIKLALYVYITLAKMKSIDERIYQGNKDSAYRVIEESFTESIDAIASKRKATCISLSYLYEEILNRLGIRCVVLRTGLPDVHYFNNITLSNGKQIIADLEKDLYRIQTKMKLQHFHSFGKEKFLNEYRLTEFLMNVGYILDGEDYRDDKINTVKMRVCNINVQDALRYFVGSEEIFGGMENVRGTEAYLYYKNAKEIVFDRARISSIYQIPCYTVNRKKEPMNSTFCMFVDTGNYGTIMPYLYSVKYGRMRTCDLLTLDKLQKEGLQIGDSNFFDRKSKLKKYIKDARIGSKVRDEMLGRQ